MPLALTTLASLVALPALAQDTFPNRPIRLLVPFTPGGVTDSSGRLIADYLGRRLGQQVIVDNKPGASGSIGIRAGGDRRARRLHAAAGLRRHDGHQSARVRQGAVRHRSKTSHRVGRIGSATLILVAHPDVPAKTLVEVITLSRTRPMAYGTSGIGGTPHIAGEMLAQRTARSSSTCPTKAAARR